MFLDKVYALKIDPWWLVLKFVFFYLPYM